MTPELLVKGKKAPDGAALEARELQLAELATGWGPTAPLWMTADLARRRPGLLARLALTACLPFWGVCGWLALRGPRAGFLEFLLLLLVPLGSLVLLGLPGAIHRDLREGDAAPDAALLADLREGLPGAIRQALTQYQFHLGEVLGPGCLLLLTPGALATAAVLCARLPGGLGALALGGVQVVWMAFVGLCSLQLVVLPFLLSLPAQLLGYPGALAQTRTRSIVAGNPGELLLFGAPFCLAAALGGWLGSLALAALLPLSPWPVLLLGPLGLAVGASGFLAVWTYRFLYELHVERERLGDAGLPRIRMPGDQRLQALAPYPTREPPRE